MDANASATTPVPASSPAAGPAAVPPRPVPDLHPRPQPGLLTRARQSLARRLYAAANAMEEVGWRLDQQEWTGAGSAPERPVAEPPGPAAAQSGPGAPAQHHGIPPAGYVGAGILASAALIAAVGWRLFPGGHRRQARR